jgi:glutamate racemase
VQSQSYLIEIEKFFPECRVYQEACPIWVPLIENNEYDNPGADYFIKKHVSNLLGKSPDIDTILLACTHYPLLIEKIRQFAPAGCSIIAQGAIVADGLVDYLKRHPEMEENCSKGDDLKFFTTDSAEDFDSKAAIFYGKPVKSTHLAL